jgi:hypothetical protein
MSEFKVNSKDYGFKPKVVVTSGGDFIITWLHTDESNGREFLASRYNDNGQVVNSEFKISNYTYNNWPDNHIAALNDGSNGFVVTYDSWLKKYDAVDNLSYSLHPDVNKPSKECNIENYCSFNSESVIANLPGGNFVFITLSYDGIFYFKKSNEIENFYSVKVDHGYRAKQISIEAFQKGNFIISWATESSLYAKMYNGAAISITEIISKKANADIKHAIAALSDGSFIVAWTTTTFQALYAKKYNQDFSLGCDEFEIPNLGQSGAYQQGSSPSIAYLNDGQFVITWMNKGNYYAKIYKNDCSVAMDQFKINSEISKSISHPDYSIPSVAALNNGNYVITWPSIKPSAYKPNHADKDSDVYAKIFNVLHCNIIANDQALTTLQYISAKLSLEVYGDGGTLPSGWSVLLSSDDPNVPKAAKVSHYFGKAYINKHNEVIISHRGTDVSLMNPTSYPDLVSDFKMVFNYIPNHYVAAEAFINYVIKEYLCSNNLLDAKVSFTGHSLGASLAELTAAHFHFPAITFESPGTNNIIHNKPSFNALKSDLKFSDSDIKYAQNNIITYNDAPDFINSMADHIGQMIRIFPSFVIYPGEKAYVDEIGYLGQPSILFYAASYSLHSQHKMLAVLDTFNENTNLPKIQATYLEWPSCVSQQHENQYIGYDDYRSVHCNPHYWISNMPNLATSDFIDKVKKEWWRFFDLKMQEWLKISKSLNDTPCKNEKVTITADNSGNSIWGTRAGGSVIKAGFGNDEYLLYGTYNQITDSGGKNTYKIIGTYEANIGKCDSDSKKLEECIKIGNMGQVIIDDASRNGEIYFGNQKLSGDAIKCTTDFCNTSKIGEIYVLLAQEGNGYLLVYNQDITYIFRNGADTVSSLDQLDNYVAIKSFNWGDFNIEKKLDEDIAFILRSNDGDVLSCLGIKTYCIAASFSGGKTFKVALDQAAKFIGDSIGINKVVVALESKSTERKLLENSVSEHSLELNQIKLGDTIDLSQLDLSGLRIERDTGNSTIYFASGEKIEVKMNPDYPLTITDPDQSGIITTKIDPNLYYEHSPTPEPDSDSGSNWHWYDTLGVVAGSTVGTGILAALGRFTYLKYYQNNPLTINSDLSEVLLSNE